MDCVLIQPELVAYHFGMIEDDARERVEKHLLECPECLRDFLALKRSMETSDERPSPLAKARLREAVASEVGRRRVAWSWWERPLAVAFAAAVILTAGSAVHALATSEGRAPHSVSVER